LYTTPHRAEAQDAEDLVSAAIITRWSAGLARPFRRLIYRFVRTGAPLPRI